MTVHKTARARYREEETVLGRVIVMSAKSACVTFIAASLLVLLSAAVISSFADPVSFIDTAAYVSLVLASLAGGCASYAISHSDYGRVSLIAGAMFCVVLLILSVVTDGAGSPLPLILGYGVSVALHYIGGMLSYKLFGERRRRRPY